MMNDTKKHIWLSILLIFPLFSLHAFFENNFRKLNMQNGLADNSVYSIHKDKDGFVWFGTGNGLSRYNGKTIQNFGTEQYNMKIDQIYETTDNLLWVVISNILYGFDRYRECFIPVKGQLNGDLNHSNAIHIVNDSLFWSVTDNKLQLLERKSQLDTFGRVSAFSMRIRKEYTLGTNSEILTHICMFPDKTKICIVTNRCRFIIFDPKKERIIIEKNIAPNADLSIQPSSILCDDEYVWIPIIGSGIVRYQRHTGIFDHYFNPDVGTPVLSHNGVYAFIPIHQKGYLAATWNGYTLFTQDKQNPKVQITEIHDNIANYQSLNLESRMISAYYDPKGLLYIGTHGGGIIMSDLREQFYRQFHQQPSTEICSIVADHEGKIWLGTFHEGIMKSTTSIHLENSDLNFSTVEDAVIRHEKAVLSAIRDEEGNLWFGNSDATLTFYDVRSKKFKVYRLPEVPNCQLSTYVWSLYIDRKKRFWVGTRNGLFLFNRQTERSTPVFIGDTHKRIDVSVRAITEGRDNEIWLGTLLGLQKLTFEKGKINIKTGFERKEQLNTGDVRSLVASSDGHLYIGYTEGLGVLSLKEDTISTFYTSRDGLCSNFIGCMTEDNKGRIWLGTNSGISRYSRHQKLFYNYYISGSNRSAAVIGKYLLFGNNNTLTYFNPDDISTSPKVEKVYPLSLEINNQPIAIEEKRNGQVILKKGISYTDEITLNHNNRDFSLTFSNLSFSSNLQKYKYRLLPYQREWIVSDAGKASYTNLPTGNYTLEMRSIYPDGVNSEVTTLSVKILPHWSQSVWFRICMMTLLCAMIYYVIFILRRKQKRIEREMLLEHELQLSKVEREKEKQIREEREHFFTNVAHELRTPLTLLLSPLQELLRKTKNSDKAYPSLTLMYKNGSFLHRLIDDLLCVQKIEAGMVKLQLSEINLAGIIKDIVDSFQPMAETQGINLTVDWPQESIPLWIDVTKISSAIRNLLSNALKYTPPKGWIKLSFERKEIDGRSFGIISVADNGTGIPDKLQKRIFDSFITGYQEPRFSTKMGIGLRIVKNTMDLHHGMVTVKSTLGEGTIFTLAIPEGRSHFIKDDYEIIAPLSGEEKLEDIPEEVYNAQPTEENTPSTAEKHTLLIIEDNADMRDYISGLFSRKYTIFEAKNGEEGVRIATEKLPELIISDVMMPVKDGFTCCREIRAQLETAHIPILMLTAKSEDIDVIKGVQMGADEYVMKPFNPQVLITKVERLILRRKQLKRIYTKSLMLKITPKESGETEVEEDTFMQMVTNIVEANLTNEAFNVQMLAKQLNTSQPTLYRKIKQHSNLSVIEVIRSVRMSKAASLVMENRYSIQEISERVGYNDSNTFRKHFTEQFGVPPSKFM